MSTAGYWVQEDAARRLKQAQGRSTGRWVASLIVLVLLTEPSSFSFLLVVPALPEFAAKYGTTQPVWIMTVFILVGAVVAPIVGKLGDRFGRRRVLAILVAVTAVGGALCALAPSFEILLLGRALTGVSLGFVPLVYALIRDVFPERMRALGISIAINGVGIISILAPFLAGYLIDFVSIEAVFWFIAALAAIGGVGLVLVPESPFRTKNRIDVPGAVLLGLGLLLILLGVSQGLDWGWLDGRTLGCIIGGAVLLVLWVLWERRAAEPLMDLKLLSSRPFAAVLFAGGFGYASLAVISSYFPTMVRTPGELGQGYGFGISATELALWMVPSGLLTVAAGFVVGIMAKRHGFRVFMLLGALMFAVSGVVLATFQTEAWMAILGYACIGLGALLLAAAPNLILQVAPPDQRGIAAGMYGTAINGLGSIGTAVTGTILAANVSQVVEGSPVYSDAGISAVFFIGAGFAVVSLLIGFAIPVFRRSAGSAQPDDDDVLSQLAVAGSSGAEPAGAAPHGDSSGLGSSATQE